MRSHRLATTALSLLLLLPACGDASLEDDATIPTRSALHTSPSSPTSDLSSSSTVPFTGSGDIDRAILTYDQLMFGFDPPSPVDEWALARPDGAAAPSHNFEGRLTLSGEDVAGNMMVLQGNPNLEPEMGHLPEFDYQFVRSGDVLVPVQRGLIIADHPIWNYIIEPGRVWKENGDQGYSRASFPFSLVFKGGNSTYNGVMSFLFSEEEVSKVWYQITQETSMAFSADFWGLLDAAYHAGPVAGADQIRDAFAQESAGRFPTKSIEQLTEDYPGTDPLAFGDGVTPRHLTWYGFVINGVNYVGGCQTRFGAYPYCESMRAPSFSTAKSAFVSVALMRLAQQYDPGVPDLLIRDFVPESAGSPGDWRAVTFDHVLDMATGNYRSAGFMVDEEHFDTDPFWNEAYYEPKIEAAFNWPHSAEPGTQWVYRTFDTFILTRALQNYLITQEGDQADIFQYVVDEVYQPLGIGPGAYTSLRTKDNNWSGQALGGYGMWWVPDDLAKITHFLNVDGGVVAGRQLLDPDILTAALQRNPADRGVSINARQKYNNSFWADPYSEADGFDCEFWAPQMLGYSGIVVMLMPNGSAYYYASDNREFTWSAVLRESDKIKPFCQ
jgi:hypothetical protein